MEGADVRRPVAEEGDRDARLAAQLERERGAGDRGQPAADDGVRAQVPALDVVEVHRAAVAVRAALELPVQLGHDRVRVRPARERVPVRAVGRGEDVAVVHRLADADRDRLLADRHVQEPGQLAGAEPLLDLLLEAPDQEHLAQELAQPLLGQAPFRLDLRHGLSLQSAVRWRRHLDVHSGRVHARRARARARRGRGVPQGRRSRGRARDRRGARHRQDRRLGGGRPAGARARRARPRGAPGRVGGDALVRRADRPAGRARPSSLRGSAAATAARARGRGAADGERAAGRAAPGRNGAAVAAPHAGGRTAGRARGRRRALARRALRCGPRLRHPAARRRPGAGDRLAQVGDGALVARAPPGSAARCAGWSWGRSRSRRSTA